MTAYAFYYKGEDAAKAAPTEATKRELEVISEKLASMNDSDAEFIDENERTKAVYSKSSSPSSTPMVFVHPLQIQLTDLDLINAVAIFQEEPIL